jgi:hypothetical protein
MVFTIQCHSWKIKKIHSYEVTGHGRMNISLYVEYYSDTAWNNEYWLCDSGSGITYL